MSRSEAEQRGYDAGRVGTPAPRGYSLDLEWLRGYYDGAEAARDGSRKIEAMRNEKCKRDRSLRMILYSVFFLLFLIGIANSLMPSKKASDAARLQEEQIKFERQRMDTDAALERERLALERYRIDIDAKGTTTPSTAGLLILKDFVQKEISSNAPATLDTVQNLISAMAETGTMAVSTAANLGSDILKEAAKQGTEGTKQILVKLGSNLIDKYIKAEPAGKNPLSRPEGSHANAIIEINSCEKCQTCPPPPKPPAPKDPPIKNHKADSSCKARGKRSSSGKLPSA